ncbi:hypothetical protein CBA19CS11_09065 [Caballeronia novacaledonica]|jgi:hypothetical protein|uniref:hypothetical protein n=1 Tax=Caballeronia novacaledonica TaxID=1544861 RepID=UPI001EE16C72|nr:hypothetical protein [Caballeronia novacaledonica]GJH08973.1 hypothetical protein CBA19CS11_09065 [Caballeronia novacaledonica]
MSSIGGASVSGQKRQNSAPPSNLNDSSQLMENDSTRRAALHDSLECGHEQGARRVLA